MNNVFLDDPDSQISPATTIDGGTILRKLRHPAPALDEDIDPEFYSPFIPVKHEELMCKDLDVSHLDPNLQGRLYDIIRKYWSVFDEKGVFIPVKHYGCVIDTGTARPISVRKILYGECKNIIMCKCMYRQRKKKIELWS